MQVKKGSSRVASWPQEQVEAVRRSPDVYILALDYCKTGLARRCFLQVEAVVAIWCHDLSLRLDFMPRNSSLQLNLPVLCRKMAIWIGLAARGRLKMPKKGVESA